MMTAGCYPAGMSDGCGTRLWRGAGSHREYVACRSDIGRCRADWHWDWVHRTCRSLLPGKSARSISFRRGAATIQWPTWPVSSVCRWPWRTMPTRRPWRRQRGAREKKQKAPDLRDRRDWHRRGPGSRRAALSGRGWGSSGDWPLCHRRFRAACLCGFHGCWESLAAGPAMSRGWRATCRKTTAPRPLNRQAICELAQKGDELARQAADRESSLPGPRYR